ncbi:MAG: rRNA adenine N-6-methyltransferase family protein [Patescibacteria group bacterium]
MTEQFDFNSPQEEIRMRKEKYKTDLLEKIESFGIELDPDRKDQHLIVDPEVIEDMVSFAEISPDDVVLEIGSGPGNITEKLAERAGHVYAVEVDPRFKPILDDLQSRHPNTDIIMGDFLELELPAFNKIVANPPFSILEPMIQKLSDLDVEQIVLAIGEKYYRRSVAEPGSGDFTKTSLFTQAHFKSSVLRKLEKEVFFPKSREIAVIMKLLSVGGRGNSIMRHISNAFSKNAGQRVNILVNNIINQFGPRMSKSDLRNHPDKIVPLSLHISQGILSKRLQELSNNEISSLVRRLISVNQRVR